jgi:hypothetical protein
VNPHLSKYSVITRKINTGRRVLESYLLLFLNSAPNLSARHDLEEITARAINTYTLGKHIGSRWGLGRIVRWVPTLPKQFVDKADMASNKPFGSLSKRAGLYKVQGDAVAAVMGAIFQQFVCASFFSSF